MKEQILEAGYKLSIRSKGIFLKKEGEREGKKKSA